MSRIADDILMHHGVSALDGAPGRGSGRYPLGSGNDPNQHSGDFATRVQALRKQGWSDQDIAKEVGAKSTKQLRALYSQSVNDRRMEKIARVKEMLAQGKSQADVARELGVNESTVRSLLNARSEARTNAARKTADFLKEQVEQKGMIDVGAGVEWELGGISRTKLDQALETLREEGYPTYGLRITQVTNPNGQATTFKVLCKPGTEHKDVYDAAEKNEIDSITDHKARENADGVETIKKGFEYPASLDSSRLLVRYRDDITPDGHAAVEKDGTIEIRRGVADLDLGESKYAQVRILVDNDKYIKGMAFYSDDLPDGIDIAFNSNKVPGDKVLKSIKTDDPTNPFGALLREEGGQYHYIDSDGNEKLGLINKTRMEGDWGEWADKLPSQFLSKQSVQLIKTQLDTTIADSKAEYDDICALTNPTVKRNLLESYANECDSAAEHLKAAALPRQKYQVILPVATLKDDEVYAPNYQDGETLALIRYPHGGTFEIPIVKVNNKQEDAQRIIGADATDAIGINANVAARLSGADFDGDTVMCIPCNSSRSKVRITSTPELEGLKGFDPKMEYGPSSTSVDDNDVVHYYANGKEYKPMSKGSVQREMGEVSNLITDMTLKGATTEELTRAVRHSMVVIDAEKHHLDYKQSYVDNDIRELKDKYQLRVDEDGSEHRGASTLISRAKSETQVLKRKGSPHTDPDTGELVYKEVEEYFTDPKTGKQRVRTQKSTAMRDTNDARTLISDADTVQEELYASYANYMKSQANSARLEILKTGRLKYDSNAREVYSNEVDALESELMLSLKNAPRERMAQQAASSEMKALKQSNPTMTTKDIKKQSQLALTRARARYGASRHKIDITPKQWEAIQAGAVSDSKLTHILRFADTDQVRTYATPKSQKGLSQGKQARIKALRLSGYTNAQIAEALGISTTTVVKYAS